jgi:hypothetical protein
VSRPDFQTARKAVLGRLSAERRKVPLAALAEAYPIGKKVAA